MAIANHVIRRRAFYAWRRVWRGNAVQIPLSTTDPTRARRLATAATAAASVGWGLLDAGRITLHDVRQEILRAVQHERLALDYEAAGGNPKHSRPGGRAFYFFFSLTADGPDDEPDPSKKTSQPAPDAANGAELPSPPAVAAGEPLDAVPDMPVPADDGNEDSRPPVLAAFDPAPAIMARSPDLPPQTAPQPRDVASGKGPHMIQEVVPRLGKMDKRTGRASDKTIEQCAGIAALFVELTRVADVRAIRQRHIAAFVDGMDRMPPVYRRSAAEQNKPIAKIIAEAEASGVKCGLSSATINRNLIQIGKILEFAKSQDLGVDPSINPSSLRRFEKKNAKDDRDPFTPEDVKRLFAAPVWTGSKSANRRRKPGDVVVKDWLYWVPLIAAYTGARREEICGLETADIEEDGGVPIFRIRPNTRRDLKNAQSERRIPIHSHLLELGFFGLRPGPAGAEPCTPVSRLEPEKCQITNRGFDRLPLAQYPA